MAGRISSNLVGWSVYPEQSGEVSHSDKGPRRFVRMSVCLSVTNRFFFLQEWLDRFSSNLVGWSVYPEQSGEVSHSDIGPKKVCPCICVFFCLLLTVFLRNGLADFHQIWWVGLFSLYDGFKILLSDSVHQLSVFAVKTIRHLPIVYSHFSCPI